MGQGALLGILQQLERRWWEPEGREDAKKLGYPYRKKELQPWCHPFRPLPFPAGASSSEAGEEEKEPSS